MHTLFLKSTLLRCDWQKIHTLSISIECFYTRVYLCNHHCSRYVEHFQSPEFRAPVQSVPSTPTPAWAQETTDVASVPVNQFCLHNVNQLIPWVFLCPAFLCVLCDVDEIHPCCCVFWVVRSVLLLSSTHIYVPNIHSSVVSVYTKKNSRVFL